MLQPVGPEALGWFKEPINSMADFRKYRFRTPPGICIQGLVSFPPASNNKTLILGLAESLFARTHPAEPAPIII